MRCAAVLARIFHRVDLPCDDTEAVQAGKFTGFSIDPAKSAHRQFMARWLLQIVDNKCNYINSLKCISAGSDLAVAFRTANQRL